MLVEDNTAQDEELFSYIVASGDMRFIENNQRALFLRREPELGTVIRGEVAECGPTCHANLSQVLLEYVMSCEDGRLAHRTAMLADRFGQRLGRAFVALRYPEPSGAPASERLSDAGMIVIHSMDVPVTFDQTDDVLRFTLAYCPLHTAAGKAGLSMWVPLAHRALVAMLETLLQGIALEWALQSPVERESDAPLQEICFARMM